MSETERKDVQSTLDALEHEMDQTLIALQDDARPKAMMAGVSLAFRILWKAIRLVADAREPPVPPPPSAAAPE